MLCADIGVDLTVPGLVGSLKGIGFRTGQVVNIINIGFAVAVCVGGIHLDRCAVVEVNDLRA